MSAHNNTNNNTNNTNNRSELRELPTSDLLGSLVPSPLTSDELGSGLAIAPMTSTVETTTVVMREDEFVPLRAGSYLEQEAVMESKSTSSVHDDNSEESWNTEINECNGGICSTTVVVQYFDGLIQAGV
jgi:hypothetical protein